MEEREHLDELLPVGSVVLLKDAPKKIVIMGIIQVQNEKVFDYMGVLYPEGYVGKNGCFLFNHENIEQVIYRGYEDDERKGYIQFLKLAYDSGQEVIKNYSESNLQEKENQ